MSEFSKMFAKETVVEESPIVEKTTAVRVIHDPVFINTEWGATAVYGYHEVSKRELEILAACLMLPEFAADQNDHRVRSVVFRTDNRPINEKGEPILANATPIVGGIAINLMQTVVVAMEESLDNPKCSIKASYYRNIILSFLHEIQHISTLLDIPTDPDRLQEEEDLANEWAMEKLYYLAKNVNLEPAHHTESPYLCRQIMELLKEKDDDWSQTQRRYLDNNILYSAPKNDEHDLMEFHSFKGYLHLMSGDKYDVPEWNKESASPLAAIIRAIDNTIPAMEPELPPMVAQMSNPFPHEMFEIDERGGFDPNNVSYTPPVLPTFPTVASDYPFVDENEGDVPNIQVIGTVVATPVVGSPSHQYQAASADQAQPVVQVYPRTGLTEAQTGEIVKALYGKIYSHIFHNCGRQLNNDMAFKNPENVYVSGIPLTEMEKRVVVKMNCLDPNGRWCPNMRTEGGLLFGSTMKNTKLPTYTLFINADGFERVRVILPQNTAKRDASGAYTKPTLLARSGSCIMYVMEGNDDVAKSTGKKFLMKIVDGQILAC
jgi:hypothetical protein